VVDRFPGAKCWMSFQCRDGAHTARGERFDEVVTQILSHPAASSEKLLAVGVNCCRPRDVAPLLRLANKANHWTAWKDKFVFRQVFKSDSRFWQGNSKIWMIYFL
jgi:S-methylmethionine-dependent homocysteine/selenocysteine methylase